MDVEITMESLQKVFNTVMYKSEADYINMVVIDVTKQKETEEKLSKAIVDANHDIQDTGRVPCKHEPRDKNTYKRYSRYAPAHTYG